MLEAVASRSWFGLALLGAVVLTVGSARLVSRALLFPASRVSSQPAPDDFVRHTLEAADGVAVHAIELPALGGARTLVHFHNNRETAESGADVARALHSRGLGVVLAEYRGYGASREGEPTEEGLYLDAEAVLDLLARRGVGPDRVVLWGTSLGTGVAAEMAQRGRGGRLILVTPYTSIPDLLTGVVPFLPARALVRDHFDTLTKARRIRVPTLVIHGDADEIVPFSMGEQVTRAIDGARLLRIPSGRHGDLFGRAGVSLIAAMVAFGSS
jgi:fermentation-respiration switch protein FrsA (DUF1100 family)